MSQNATRKAMLSLPGRDAATAFAYACQVVADLKPGDFWKQDPQRKEPMLCDVYGVQNSEGTWYVKVFLNEVTNTLTIRSCHLLKYDMVLESKAKLKADPNAHLIP